jgi:hypothetical protein
MRLDANIGDLIRIDFGGGKRLGLVVGSGDSPNWGPFLKARVYSRASKHWTKAPRQIFAMNFEGVLGTPMRTLRASNGSTREWRCYSPSDLVASTIPLEEGLRRL